MDRRLEIVEGANQHRTLFGHFAQCLRFQPDALFRGPSPETAQHQRAKEESGTIPHPIDGLAQLIGIVQEDLEPETAFAITDEVVHSVVADGNAEILRGHILQLMRLVYDRVGATGDDFAVCALPDGGIGAEEMMIDNDEIRLGGALPHARDETFAVSRTLGADAVFRARGNAGPERDVFGKLFEFCAIPGLGARSPRVEQRDPGRGGFEGSLRALPKALVAVQAQVVAPPLHAGGLEWGAKGLPQKRKIFRVDLLLKVLGAGGHEDAMSAQNGRHQIGERLSGSRTGFGEQHATPIENIGNSRRHLTLSLSRLEVRDGPRKGTIVCKRRSNRGS